MVLVAIYDRESLSISFLFDLNLNPYKIPLYAIFKLWITVISPMILGTKETTSTEGPSEKEPSGSKRQEKLRKRHERGDGRVRPQPSKK
jgi:hypothetical protein